jgi:hypothetical protein
MARKESRDEMVAREKRERESRLRLACEVLALLGVATVKVRYDGAGDDGSIEEFTYDPALRAGLPEGLEGMIEDYVIWHLPEGWEINSGSYGTITVDVATGRAKHDHNWRLEDEFDEEEFDEEWE